jgi:SMC interacting uncharacterized protein involved in chromosome segregation
MSMREASERARILAAEKSVRMHEASSERVRILEAEKSALLSELAGVKSNVARLTSEVNDKKDLIRALQVELDRTKAEHLVARLTKAVDSIPAWMKE